MKVAVSLSLNIFEKLTYEFSGDPDDLYIGMRVIVPVGNIIRSGWITSLNSDYKGRTRKIIGFIKSNWRPSEYTLDFILKISELYLMSEGTLLDYCLHPGNKSIKDIYINFEGKQKKFSNFTLKEILKMSKFKPLNLNYKKVSNLHEELIMGKKLSYKKEYLFGESRFKEYKNIITRTLKNDKVVLIIVPDKLSIEYFKKTFPDIDVYNSTQKKSVKETIWEKYSNGKSGIIIGGLSALFLQINNLGCIISEKGNTLYSNRGILSSDKDLKILSILKANSYNCPIFIGTPSMELEYFKERNNTLENISKANANVLRIKKKRRIYFLI